MRECGTIGSGRVEVKGALRPKRKGGQGAFCGSVRGFCWSKSVSVSQ